MNGRLTTSSIGDTDLYFLTTGNVVRQKFPGIEGKFHLFSRKRNPMKIDHDFLERLQREIVYLSMERFPAEVAGYTAGQHPYLSNYLQALVDGYCISPREFSYSVKDGMPDIRWWGPMDMRLNYEATITSTLTELHGKLHGIQPKEGWETNLRSFAQTMKAHEIPFAEGGTRRRLSRTFQKEVLTILLEEAGGFLRSTSNPSLAYELGLWSYGTYPHAYVQLMAAIYGYQAANLMAFVHWYDVYHGRLSNCLPDTFTTPVGLTSHRMFEKLFPQRAGNIRTFRNDSLPPEVFIDDHMLPYVRHRGIDPSEVTIVHSDGMNKESTLRAAEYTRNAGFKPMFIIGTYLTYTISGNPGFDLAAKLEEVRLTPDSDWIPVCKLSDEIEKRSGPGNSINQALEELGLK